MIEPSSIDTPKIPINLYQRAVGIIVAGISALGLLSLMRHAAEMAWR